MVVERPASQCPAGDTLAAGLISSGEQAGLLSRWAAKTGGSPWLPNAGLQACPAEGTLAFGPVSSAEQTGLPSRSGGFVAEASGLPDH